MKTNKMYWFVVAALIAAMIVVLCTTKPAGGMPPRQTLPASTGYGCNDIYGTHCGTVFPTKTAIPTLIPPDDPTPTLIPPNDPTPTLIPPYPAPLSCDPTKTPKNTPTEVVPTATEVVPTATEVVPTATEVVPTETKTRRPDDPTPTRKPETQEPPVIVQAVKQSCCVCCSFDKTREIKAIYGTLQQYIVGLSGVTQIKIDECCFALVYVDGVVRYQVNLAGWVVEYK